VKAFFLAWNAANQPLVWNGQDWVHSASEPEHRQKAQLVREDVARQNHNAMRARFPRLSIEVVPIAEPQDVAARAERRGRR
jgi:hypothetical protein